MARSPKSKASPARGIDKARVPRKRERFAGDGVEAIDDGAVSSLGDALEGTGPDELPPAGNPWVAVALAWVLPGAGHFYLGRRSRAAVFFVVVVSFVLFGVDLEGELVWSFESWLRAGATLASLGTGIAYAVLHFALGYEGRILAPGYEYGSAFLLSAGLMNWLLMLDARDISLGRKS